MIITIKKEIVYDKNIPLLCVEGDSGFSQNVCPYYVVRDRNHGKKGIDKSKDKIIMKMEKREVFERYLQWNNLIGWGNSILDAVENIFDVQLGE